ncbi:MAG: S8 family serine peptidase, partial [bacterium]|nr:S8 family serine peptidase [bacterium]
SSCSKYGTWVDVTAPGSNIYSTIRENLGPHTYAYMSGTSMASPYVVGLVGLCKSFDSGATRQQIRNAIEDSCVPLNNDSYYNNGYMGEGLINADGALDELGGSQQNQRPGPFDLLDPTDGASISLPYTFDWGDSVDPDNDDIIYTLRYADNPDFNDHGQVGQLTESEHTFSPGDFTPGTTYWWKVRARDDVPNPLYKWSNQTWSFTVGTSDADDGDPGIPIVYSLSTAVPNPSQGNAVIRYALPHTSNVSLEVYDIRGRKIATLVQGEQNPGYYDTTVNGLSSGIYIYRLTAGTFAATKKMVVIK